MVAKLYLYYPVTKRAVIQLYRIPATLLIAQHGVGIASSTGVSLDQIFQVCLAAWSKNSVWETGG